MPKLNFFLSLGKLLTMKVAGTVLVAPNVLFLSKVANGSNATICIPILSNHVCSNGILAISSSIAVAIIGLWLVVSAINDFKQEKKMKFRRLVMN